MCPKFHSQKYKKGMEIPTVSSGLADLCLDNLMLDLVDMHSTLLPLSPKSAERKSTQPFSSPLCFHPSPLHLLIIQNSEGNSHWRQFVSLQLQTHHLLFFALTLKTKSFNVLCVLGTSLLSSLFPTLIFLPRCSHADLLYALWMCWVLFHLKTLIPALFSFFCLECFSPGPLHDQFLTIL